ncbi:glucose-1-phosphate adenylyltransferase large subunit 1 [Selaginella moellendorffii]|uniref:glucose-1-phosphate adenylyltransferase large subunit 1 n=1 Tax=Selaginella moellendorffii TaxID=88036 RepID=UPI000D1CF13C|nr:glucose-1-phosphate adenylyltransferase large subunit 1 [Selaginella moellendorffii]|eukprot:XP_024536250.1 glucose-1-phosphate adenylyltransferase large subunit 1 [Selaginella moellendorffii]
MANAAISSSPMGSVSAGGRKDYLHACKSASSSLAKRDLFGAALHLKKIPEKSKPRIAKCQAAQKGGNAALSSAVLVDYPPREAKQVELPFSVFETPRVDPKSVVSIILGGGVGTRLFPLTKQRAKPAVPIGGGYRLIDVPMSNCINSGINRVFVLTQFNSASLNRHLARTYNFINAGDGFVEVLAATQTPGESGMNWFQGTADAVRQFTWLFEDVRNKDVDYVLVLSGDHLYRMDYMDFVQKHKDSGADITISCVPVDESRASDFGLVKTDARGRIISFSEKPKGMDLKAMQVDTTALGLSREEAKKMPYIASMGIYVFRKDVLLKLLRWRYPTSNDFGSEIIPAAASEYNVQAYLFNDYWEDIGTIKSFFDANLALTAQPPKFSFYDASNPIFTSPRFLPPTKMEKCRIIDSIVSHGCFLKSCSVEHSLIGVRSRLESGVELKDTIIMGADSYETEAEIAALRAQGKVPLGVGEHTTMRNCLVDKNARIGSHVIITNTDGVQEAERPSEGIYIRSGITVVVKNSIVKDGTVI